MPQRNLMLLGCALACAPFTFAKTPPPANAARRFSPPSALDSLLDANPVALPAVKPASDVRFDPMPSPVRGDTALPKKPAAFQIQLDALSDIDSAQARKGVLEKLLGGKIEMVFDPPFYKLRFGNFPTKREAEDALTELSGKNLQGFVIRQ